MSQFTREDQQRAQAWLRERVEPADGRKGLSSYEVRDVLKPFGSPSQSTVARAILDLKEGNELKNAVTRAILARLAFEKAEAKRIQDAREAAAQPPRDVTEGVPSTEQVSKDVRISTDVQDTPTMAPVQAQQPLQDPELDEKRSRVVYEQLRAVIARQVERGLVPETDLTEGIVRGDGEHYLQNLQPFKYEEPTAEAVGFLNKDDVLPDGRTASYYTDGVPLEQRRQKWALSRDAPRDRAIGSRPANVVPVIPYYDDNWFWGHLKGAVDRWRGQLGRFESWITNGVPKNVSKEDAAAYEELLRLTVHLRYQTITYDGPAPDVTYATLKREIELLRHEVRRIEDAAKVKGWAVGLAGLLLLGIIHSWVLLSAAPGLILLRETVEGWRTTGPQPGAELLLLLASPLALAVALAACTMLFLISVVHTRTRPYWGKKRRSLRRTRALGVLMILVAAMLMPSVVAFGELPGL